MNWNWKLIAVVSISLILLILCYLTIVSTPDIKKYFNNYNLNKTDGMNYVQQSKTKIRINFSKEEDFIKFVGNLDNEVAYYFPEGCPSYKSEYYLVDFNDNKENYHVPEDGYLIIVKKDHKWTKEPNFLYWKVDKTDKTNKVDKET